MFRRHFFAFLTLLIVVLAPAVVRAELKLPALVSDHMVLQRDAVLPIWGWADPGAEVTVAIAGQTRQAKADADGRWELTLDKLSVGPPQTLSVSSAGQVMTIRDVLVGDVWLCSGQSNMAMTVNRAENADQEIAQANYPQIRHFKTKAQARADAPQLTCEGQWAVCSPDTVAGFTAAGYFFARELHQRLQVPIGLINSSWGGTCVEAWTPRAALAAVGPGRQAIAQYEQNQAGYNPDQAQAQFARAQDRYQQAVEEYRAARKAGNTSRKAPRRPSLTPPPDRNQNSPSALYNGMIQPLVPYALRGAIWYQGERNGHTWQSGVDYHELLTTLITSWRKVWGQGEFPFFFVQLPNYNAAAWPAIRESFLKTLDTPGTGMAITIDVGDVKDIHPKNKQAVGRRLALSALHVAYGQELAHCGPLYRSMAVDGSRVRLTFDCVFDGLQEPADGALQGFVIAGSDRKFVPAQAKIDGKSVLVWSSEVSRPVAVRYAWEANPTCNLANQAGLPASPFRTDAWELE